jgi:uncharacterized membrane protein YhaH (DUF805 family)
MEWYLKVLKNYVNFRGRARRKEYWMFFLFNIIAALILMILDFFVLGTYGVLYGLYLLAVILPSLAVTIRRLHDLGKSGWWIFISLIPVIGGIWLLVLLVMDGTTGENLYGPSPKAAAPAAA